MRFYYALTIYIYIYIYIYINIRGHLLWEETYYKIRLNLNRIIIYKRLRFNIKKSHNFLNNHMSLNLNPLYLIIWSKFNNSLSYKIPYSYMIMCSLCLC